jgi:ribonucleoside-diphosphate reductase alpha chain
MAYEEDLKGITIYRDGSRQGQVLTTGTERKIDSSPKTDTVSRAPRERARVTNGFTEKVMTGCGSLYITVNSDDKGICEVFSHLGKAGGCAVAQLEATCRLISISLRAGVGVDSIVKQLRGIRCPSPAWQNGKSILSCGDAIASVLERFTETVKSRDQSNGSGLERIAAQEFAAVKNTAGQCPECASILVYEEGCFKCPGCGYTKC